MQIDAELSKLRFCERSKLQIACCLTLDSLRQLIGKALLVQQLGNGS